MLLGTGCNASSRQLSTEETQILTAAAPSDSMFYWTRFDGKLEVYVNGADLVPNQNPMTTEAWMDAINSLEQRGFSSNDGLKVGVFVLTSKGHAAAEQLAANARSTLKPNGSEI
ncbi:hypothetical protein [Rubripirellula amarantea]|nr:hypothetical protein [Rubripirellula amarantea]